MLDFNLWRVCVHHLQLIHSLGHFHLILSDHCFGVPRVHQPKGSVNQQQWVLSHQCVRVYVCVRDDNKGVKTGCRSLMLWNSKSRSWPLVQFFRGIRRASCDCLSSWWHRLFITSQSRLSGDVSAPQDFTLVYFLQEWAGRYSCASGENARFKNNILLCYFPPFSFCLCL